MVVVYLLVIPKLMSYGYFFLRMKSIHNEFIHVKQFKPGFYFEYNIEDKLFYQIGVL